MLYAIVWNLLASGGLAILLGAAGRAAWLARRPALRHWLWLALLAKLVAPPLVALPILPEESGGGPVAGRLPEAAGEARVKAAGELSFGEQRPAGADGTHRARAGTGQPSGPADRRGTLAGGNPPVWQVIDAWQHAPYVFVLHSLLAVSLAGTAVFWFRAAARGAWLFRWLREASTDDPRIALECADVARRLGLAGRVRTFVVDARITPLMCPWVRPVVVLPRQLIDGLSQQQLRAMLAHELAHLVRRDHWTNAFALAVRSLWWWNPVAWWADRELHAAQELCCDAIAMDYSGSGRRGYAQMLLRALEFVEAEVPIPRVLAVGMGSRNTVFRRFNMIGETRLGYRLSPAGFLGLAAIVAPLLCIPVRGESGSPDAQQRAAARPASNSAPAGSPSAEQPAPAEEEEEAYEQEENFPDGKPPGDCAIGGKVISAATGKPVGQARVYLFHIPTYAPLFIHTASDGSFLFKGIHFGPYSLQVSRTPGYQDTHYNPENKPGALPLFSLDGGEKRLDLVLKITPAYSIRGAIREKDGGVPRDIENLTVLGWTEREETEGFETTHGKIDREDGTYLIDGLGDKPVYVMVLSWRSDTEDDVPPPVYYPSTFFREEAKRITFDDGKSAEGIDITIRRTGGLLLEGTVVDDHGKPVPEAFIVAHHRDMLFDYVTDYTDAEGNYSLKGLGSGDFLVHADASHRGLVRQRKPFALDRAKESGRLDFQLNTGMTISGRFVDAEGRDWSIADSTGSVHRMREDGSSGGFSLTGFRSRYAPRDRSDSRGSSFLLGEGDYDSLQMTFPTKHTFLVQGAAPGKTMITFSAQKLGEKVFEILRGGRDVRKTGIDGQPGNEISDILIVIGKPEYSRAEKN